MWKKKSFIPIFFIIVIFLADKIMLSRDMQQCCSRNTAGKIFDESPEDLFDIEKFRESKAGGKKVAVIFGSSLSYGFYYLHIPEYGFGHNPFVGRSVAETVNEWVIVPVVYPGASIFTHFVRYFQMIESGIRPDLIVVEFSMGTINSRSPMLEQELMNAMPAGFFARHFSDLNPDHALKYLASKLFVTLNHKPGRPQPLQDIVYLRIKDVKSGKPLTEVQQVSFIPGKESSMRLLEHEFYFHVMRNLFSKKTYKTLAGYGVKIAKHAALIKVPVVFWYPRLHPEMDKYVNREENRQEWLKTAEKLDNNYVVVVDHNKEKAECDLFIDPMHMDIKCYPEIFNKLVLARRQSYDE